MEVTHEGFSAKAGGAGPRLWGCGQSWDTQPPLGASSSGACVSASEEAQPHPLTPGSPHLAPGLALGRAQGQLRRRNCAGVSTLRARV